MHRGTSISTSPWSERLGAFRSNTGEVLDPTRREAALHLTGIALLLLGIAALCLGLPLLVVAVAGVASSICLRTTYVSRNRRRGGRRLTDWMFDTAEEPTVAWPYRYVWSPRHIHCSWLALRQPASKPEDEAIPE